MLVGSALVIVYFGAVAPWTLPAAVIFGAAPPWTLPAAAAAAPASRIEASVPAAMAKPARLVMIVVIVSLLFVSESMIALGGGRYRAGTAGDVPAITKTSIAQGFIARILKRCS